MLTWLKRLFKRPAQSGCQHDWLELAPHKRVCKVCSALQWAPVPFKKLKVKK